MVDMYTWYVMIRVVCFSVSRVGIRFMDIYISCVRIHEVCWNNIGRCLCIVVGIVNLVGIRVV